MTQTALYTEEQIKQQQDRITRLTEELELKLELPIAPAEVADAIASCGFSLSTGNDGLASDAFYAWRGELEHRS